MKQTSYILAAVLLLGNSAFAQDQTKKQRRDSKQMNQNKQEIMRTDSPGINKPYNINEDRITPGSGNTIERDRTNTIDRQNSNNRNNTTNDLQLNTPPSVPPPNQKNER